MLEYSSKVVNLYSINSKDLYIVSIKKILNKFKILVLNKKIIFRKYKNSFENGLSLLIVKKMLENNLKIFNP